MLTSQIFFQNLRSALNHLYDPYFLRKSPLVAVFALGDQPDTPSILQRILNEAIAKLEPQSGDASYVQRRRGYELIMYRYIQQFNQEEVANQLGLSVRHLRREQNAAIYDLAARLWEQYHLGSKPFQISLQDLDEPSPTGELAPGEMPAGPEESPSSPSSPASDLSWLDRSAAVEPADLKQVLPVVLDLSRHLAARYGVTIQVQLPPDLAPVLIPEVALRQLLLNILSVGVRWHSGGILAVQVQQALPHALLQLTCQGRDLPPRQLSAGEKSGIDLAAQIAEVYGGTLRCGLEEGAFRLDLSLPADHQHLVLVIDDNLDFIQLVERYLTGMHYHAISERNPRQAVAAAEQHHPDSILLDVMMPGMDGWEVLGRLRRHPATAAIPVLICSIVPQEELALSLGAAAFLRKPVSQEALLAALASQSAPPTPNPAERPVQPG